MKRKFLSLLLAAALCLPASAYAAPAEVAVSGDVDGDGAITAMDALLTLQSAAQTTALSSAQQTAAEVGGAVGVAADDALLILKKATGAIDRFPAEALTQHSLQTASETLSYWLYTPANATADMPLIVYLHGGSGKGSDLNVLMTNDGFPLYLRSGQLGEVPAYVVIPQLSASHRGWSDIKNALRELITTVQHNYAIDTGRISLTGHSMGGKGTFDIALAYPKLFARVAPLSGSVTVNDQNVQTLANTPLWAVVGSADTIVPPDSSQAFIAALQTAGANAHLAVLDGAGHFDVPAAYLDRDLGLVDWLLAK